MVVFIHIFFCWEKSTVYFQSFKKEMLKLRDSLEKPIKRFVKFYIQQILIVIQIEQCKKLKIPNAH